MPSYDIGFLGGGQLARMSIQAAQRMGLRCLSLDPGADTPASQIADAIRGDLNDAKAIAQILTQCDRVTLENEFIPADDIRRALKISSREEDCLIPGLHALATIQDKLHQREALSKAGVPSPLAVPIHEHPELAKEAIGFPMVLKARFGGYDGKGTRYAKTEEELNAHHPLWSAGGWLAESFVPFKRELAAMVYISQDGQAGCFPTMETVQTNHVCDLVFPSGTDASDTAIAAVKAVGGVGLFGVEMFELQDGSIQINELAPRPHNTGHYTLDWGGVSQFEQHVRLVMGLQVQEARGQDACMANLLGQPHAHDHRKATRAALEAVPEAHVHWYGKAESRPGRKMGHINVVGGDCIEKAKAAREAFYKEWTS